jgi:hypothetical protein
MALRGMFRSADIKICLDIDSVELSSLCLLTTNNCMMERFMAALKSWLAKLLDIMPEGGDPVKFIQTYLPNITMTYNGSVHRRSTKARAKRARGMPPGTVDLRFASRALWEVPVFDTNIPKSVIQVDRTCPSSLPSNSVCVQQV